MKFKSTLILLAVFAVLLAVVLLFEWKGKRERAEKDKEAKLVEIASADVEKLTLKKEDGTIVFQKGEKGEWLLTQPVEAKADSYEVNRLVEDLSSLKFERVVEENVSDLAKYEIPKIEVELWRKDQPQPVKILVGMESPLDKALFAKRDDEKRVVLLPSFLKSQLDKKPFDFREKDIFKFEAEEVAAIKLRAKEISWTAQKKDGEWFLQTPLKALAEKSRVEDVLRALSNLRAKEFVAEQKGDAEILQHGLADPEYSVSLSLPAKNQELVFSLHKKEETVYATTSLSPKIITAESQVLTDLEKKAEDLREKQVVVFNSWEARKLQIKKGGLTMALAKDKEDQWRFEEGAKEEADKSKVETFIRKVESLEAAEFIDSPANLKDFGLDPPQAEVDVWTGEVGTEKQFQVLVGAEDAGKKQVVLKNPKLGYLFRVDSSFLGEVPKEAKDLKPAAPVEKKEEKKEGGEKEKD